MKRCVSDLISWWEKRDSNVVFMVHIIEKYRVPAPLCRPRNLLSKGSTYYAVNHKLGFTPIKLSKIKTPSVSVPLFRILEQRHVNPSSLTGILYIRFYTKAVAEMMSLKEPQLRLWNNTSPPHKMMTQQMVVIAERESLTTTATRDKTMEIVLQGGAKDKLDSFEFLRVVGLTFPTR